MADGANEEQGDAASQTRLDHRPGNEERSQNQPNDRIGITAERLAHRQRTGDGHGGDAHENNRAAGNWPQNCARNGRHEDCQQTPGLRGDSCGCRQQPDPKPMANKISHRSSL